MSGSPTLRYLNRVDNRAVRHGNYSGAGLPKSNVPAVMLQIDTRRSRGEMPTRQQGNPLTY